MERKFAEQVIQEMEKKGMKLTLLEAMCMTKIPTTGYEVYAIQKGDVTILAWVNRDGKAVVQTNIW